MESNGRNLFVNVQDTNPFSDPSVAQITDRSSTTVNSVSDFSPFQPNEYANRELQPSASPPPPPYYEVEVAKQNFEQRQENLNRAADSIERSQPDIQSRTVVQIGSSAKNFPPLPSCCPVRPCFYQDIALDIPAPYQFIVRAHFFYWIAYGVSLFLNVCSSFAFLHAAASKLEGGAVVGVSLGFIIVCVPLSYICWFRPVYNAFRSNSSINFFLYFIIFLCQIFKLALISIGISYFSPGWITGIDALSKYWTASGIVIIIVAFLFDVLVVAGAILMIKVNRMYRGTGANFAQAREEFSQSVATNQYVQRTASSAGRSAANGAMDQAFSSSPY